MHIGRNPDTIKFDRGNRFLIDDPLTEHKLSYLLTKPLKIGKTFNGQGIFSFVLQEVVATDDDNFELGIADYYKYFHRPSDIIETAPSYEEKYKPPEDENRKWL